MLFSVCQAPLSAFKALATRKYIAGCVPRLYVYAIQQTQHKLIQHGCANILYYMWRFIWLWTKLTCLCISYTNRFCCPYVPFQNLPSVLLFFIPPANHKKNPQRNAVIEDWNAPRGYGPAHAPQSVCAVVYNCRTNTSVNLWPAGLWPNRRLMCMGSAKPQPRRWCPNSLRMGESWGSCVDRKLRPNIRRSKYGTLAHKWQTIQLHSFLWHGCAERAL